MGDGGEALLAAAGNAFRNPAVEVPGRHLTLFGRSLLDANSADVKRGKILGCAVV
jgi:hypothetical protein